MHMGSTFKPIWWLPNGHAQTLYPTLTNRTKAPVDRFERIELPDGDFLDLAWAVNGLSKETPLVILLHGLGGSVNSVYIAGLLKSFNKSGIRGVLMHFRGAGREPNRLPRAYHSGDTADLKYFLTLLEGREPHTPKAVVGVSLGGNVLLKWLGETGAQSLIQAAVAVSVPFQLNLVAEHINKGFSRLYQAYLLRALRTSFLKKLMIMGERLPISKKDLFSLKSLRAFDEHVTAPLHGFQNADAYYQTASSRQYLKGISTPTLIIHAQDDPFMIPEVIPHPNELPENVTLELSRYGGHVGFIAAAESNSSRPMYWLEKRIPDYLNHYLSTLP